MVGEPIAEDSSPYALDDLAQAAASEQHAHAQALPQAPVTISRVKPAKVTARKTPSRPSSGALRHPMGMGWSTLIFLVLMLVSILLYVSSFIVPSMKVPLLFGLLAPAFILYIWGGIWMLIVPFREGIVYGLAYIFVPFYAIYYLLTRQDTMKSPFLRALIGGVFLVLFGISAGHALDAKKENTQTAAKNPYVFSNARAGNTAPPAPFNHQPREVMPESPRVIRAVRPRAQSDQDFMLLLRSTPESEARLAAIASRWEALGGEDILSSLKPDDHRMESGALIMPRMQKFVSTESFVPPVTFKAVVMNNGADFRFRYAADEIIFNWEMRNDEFRVGGGPASGRHKPGAGRLPDNVWVGIEWVVRPDEMIVYVDGEERYRTQADFSRIKQPLTLWSHTNVSALKELTVVKGK